MVIAIIGIATTAVGLGAFTSSTKAMTEDARRLTLLFELAHSEARAAGRPIVWEADTRGYRFRHRSSFTAHSAHAAIGSDRSEPSAANPALRAREWESPPVQVKVTPPGALVFTNEWIDAPMQIELSTSLHSVTVLRDAAGQYSVAP